MNENKQEPAKKVVDEFKKVLPDITSDEAISRIQDGSYEAGAIFDHDEVLKFMEWMIAEGKRRRDAREGKKEE